MYERILFPTDGSEGAEAALDHTVHLAELHDSELHVLFVVDTTHIGETGTTNQIRTEGEEAVESIAETVTDHGLSVTTEVQEGIPDKEILDYADEAAVDLVVMGTHGRSGLDRYVVGSVTEKVVRHSDAPVLTVRLASE